VDVRDETMVRERFEALAGPPDGDWKDVTARVRKRGRKSVALLAATAIALVATGLGIGGDVLGLFAEHGKQVPLSSFSSRDRELLISSLCRRPGFSERPGRSPEVVCRDGAPTVEEIANDGVEIHWRVRYPWGLTCLASGPVGGRRDPNHGDFKIGTLGCNMGAPRRKLVPTPARPITVDASMGASVKHPHVRLVRVSGLAGSGVARVGLVARAGPPMKTEVHGNAYSFGAIPDRPWVAIAAYDASGRERYREPLLGVGERVPLPAERVGKMHVWIPEVPPRPAEQPLQHASTGAADVDVYRNGVVEVRFRSTDDDPYRRLVRSSRFSSGVAGMTCRTVAFGAGHWENIGGGSNARVAPEMGMRLDTIHGGMPSPPFDVCEVSGTYGSYWNDEEGPRELVEAPFTAIGRRYFDERATARDLAYFVRTRKMWAIRKAIHRGEPAPGPDQLARRFGDRVVPLASRDDAAPLGKIGVWTEGDAIVASEMTPGGRRLFVTVQATRIGANNIRDLSFTF
jgi:hypothetical protein